MRSAAYPTARPGLVVNELSGETLIYDFATHKGHCTTPFAYEVLKRCDGKTSAASISAALAADRRQVEAALEQLAKAELFVEKGRSVDHARRRAMRQVAATVGLSIAAPMVWSIVAPSKAEAASAVACPLTSTQCMGTTSDNLCCGTSGGVAGVCNGNMCVTGSGCNGGTTCL
jgi:hypothetical protein